MYVGIMFNIHTFSYENTRYTSHEVVPSLEFEEKIMIEKKNSGVDAISI